jgi:type I restriction enzyme S subunit
VIVRFLDHLDSRIKRFIAAKERLIELLEEEKQAIILRAVTRGLDPDVPLKPSDIDWVGEIPEHWEVLPLKYLTRFYNGFAFKPADWGSAGTPIIRIENLNGGEVFNFTTRDDIPARLRVRLGDLLFAWSGNRGTSFGAFVWDRRFEGYLNQHIFKLEGYDLDSAYFAHLLRAVTRHVEEQAHGIIGLVHITKSKLASVRVPVAPAGEQQRIARTINRRLQRAQQVAERARREIALIREYRTRLVSDVITGKLDVRPIADQLLQDSEADDPAFDQRLKEVATT